MAKKKRDQPAEIPDPETKPEIVPETQPEEPAPGEDPVWYPEEPDTPETAPEIRPGRSL